jgi:methylase of polypeptide subunit release factors
VARHLRVARGDVVAEVGCGTGLLAAFAAAHGASRVWASDVDPACVELARRTAAANALPQVQARCGALLDPIPRSERIDLVVAVLPQKPATVEFSTRYAGGTDGADLIVALAREAAERLQPAGRLVLYHHSVAAPGRVGGALDAAYDWRVVASRARWISRRLYANLAPGMLGHALALCEAGVIRIRECGPWLVWESRVIEAVRR